MENRKQFTDEQLQQELADLNEQRGYFGWKITMPPWAYNDDTVARYQKLIAEIDADIENVHTELQARQS